MALLVLTFLMGCGENSDPSPSTGTAPDPVPSDEVAALSQARDELDRTLFAPEIDAGRHEALFVKLWDDLRNRPPYAALAEFPIGKLILGTPTPIDSPDWGGHGIKFATLSDPPQPVDQAAFKSMLSELEGSGWRIAQTEWHHSKFTPATAAAPARSTVSFEIHALFRDADQRIVVRGDLEVTWQREADGAPLPAEIDARGVQLIARRGHPMFAERMVVDPTELAADRFPRTSPILVSDLDGDSRSEVIAAGCNLAFQVDGDFNFTQRDFLDHPIPHPAQAGLLADLSGDGVKDYIGGSARDGSLLLFHGAADGRFPTPPHALPLPHLQGLHSLSAGDIDADGDLDLFVGQWKAPYVGGSMPTPFYDANDGHPDFLLRNDGAGKFTDITAAAGLVAKSSRRTFSASLVDLDSDRDLDLVVIADFAGIDVYLNDGTGTFVESTHRLVDQRHGFGMSHSFGDWDGDGTEDLYMLGMSSTTARRLDGLGLARPGQERYAQMRAPMAYGNRLYLRAPEGTLSQCPFSDSAARTGWSWGSAAADYDLDGDTDLYVTNGHLSGNSAKDYCSRFWCHDLYTGGSKADAVIDTLFKTELGTALGREFSWNGFEHNKLLLNHHGSGFFDAAFLLGVAFEYDSRATVAADLDLDGRPDLLVAEYRTATLDQRLRVYRNQGTSANQWIGVSLAATAGHSPIGAVVTARQGDRQWVRSITNGDGFTSQSPCMAHFGLGELTAIDQIEIRWPSGAVSTVETPELGRYHRFKAPPRPE